MCPVLLSLGTEEPKNCRNILVHLYIIAERRTRIQEHLGALTSENGIPYLFAIDAKQEEQGYSIHLVILKTNFLAVVWTRIA